MGIEAITKGNADWIKAYQGRKPEIVQRELESMRDGEYIIQKGDTLHDISLIALKLEGKLNKIKKWREYTPEEKKKIQDRAQTIANDSGIKDIGVITEGEKLKITIKVNVDTSAPPSKPQSNVDQSNISALAKYKTAVAALNATIRNRQAIDTAADAAITAADEVIAAPNSTPEDCRDAISTKWTTYYIKKESNELGAYITTLINGGATGNANQDDVNEEALLAIVFLSSLHAGKEIAVQKLKDAANKIGLSSAMIHLKKNCSVGDDFLDLCVTTADSLIDSNKIKEAKNILDGLNAAYSDIETNQHYANAYIKLQNKTNDLPICLNGNTKVDCDPKLYGRLSKLGVSIKEGKIKLPNKDRWFNQKNIDDADPVDSNNIFNISGAESVKVVYKAPLSRRNYVKIDIKNLNGNDYSIKIYERSDMTEITNTTPAK